MMPVLILLMSFAKLSFLISQTPFRSQITPKKSICCAAAERVCYKKGKTFRHSPFLDISLKPFLLLFDIKSPKVVIKTRE